MAYRKDLARLDGATFNVVARAEKWGIDRRGTLRLCVRDAIALGLGAVPFTDPLRGRLADLGYGVHSSGNEIVELDHIWLEGPTRDVIRPGDWIGYSGESYAYQQDDPSGAKKMGNAIRRELWERLWRPPAVMPESSAFFWTDYVGLPRLLTGYDKHPQFVLTKEPIYRSIYDVRSHRIDGDGDGEEWGASPWRVAVPVNENVCDWPAFKGTLPRQGRDYLYRLMTEADRVSDFLFWRPQTTPPHETWASIVRAD